MEVTGLRFKLFMVIMTLALWVCPKRERQNIVHWMRELTKIRKLIDEGEARFGKSDNFTLTLEFTRYQ